MKFILLINIVILAWALQRRPDDDIRPALIYQKIASD